MNSKKLDESRALFSAGVVMGFMAIWSIVRIQSFDSAEDKIKVALTQNVRLGDLAVLATGVAVVVRLTDRAWIRAVLLVIFVLATHELLSWWATS